MEKTVPLLLIILLPLIFSSICKGDITVEPREISITMNNEFIHGNTSEKITITNNDDYSINISWYLEHPNPISWMRPNKTCIPTLSWIDLDPKWCVAQPDDNLSFYIHLDIPESEKQEKQHWETWVTFKQESHGSTINHEHAVRVYIDTPGEVSISDNQDQDSLSIDVSNQIRLSALGVVIAVVIVITLLILGILIYKKKKL
jgi:hypothetical protein